MASHGHPLLLLTAVGLGGWFLLRNSQTPGVIAAPGPAANDGNAVNPPVLQPSTAIYNPAVDPSWQVEPPEVIAATEAASGINNPFAALVAAYPRGAVVEEYWAWLKRAPDVAGDAYWLAWLDDRKRAGQSPMAAAGDLIVAFQNSPEAVALRGPVQ